ncbi:MAG: hypothetical protein JSS59_03225 [Proteobacteria bacterium]|uniref:hypothetical protein n=1 Tax=Rudaea sp. TaxID=2136325 RepID=UPI003783146F|nr:hypothetical protein [Pseudomonadota bacterium]
MKASLLLAAACACLFSAQALADDARAYKEGPVTQVTYVKVKPGQFDNYMKWLDANYKPLNEALMKAKVIVSFNVYGQDARDPHDADLLLTVTYANMAALDNLDERTDPILEKFQGGRDKQNQGFADRSSMREILGSKLIRELVLK